MLEGNQKFQKETKNFGRKTKSLRGKQNKILEGNQRNRKGNFDTSRPS